MRKIKPEERKNDLALLRVAMGNAKVCSDRQYRSRVSIATLKEDIICISTITPENTNISSRAFALLSHINNLAVTSSVGKLENLKLIKTDLQKLVKLFK